MIRLLSFVCAIALVSSSANAAILGYTVTGVVKSFDETEVVVDLDGSIVKRPRSEFANTIRSGAQVEIPMTEEELAALLPPQAAK